MPTALRVPTPASPKTSFMRSEKPLITLGCSANSGVAVDHAQGLDQPVDLVERAEVGPHGRQDRQARLPRGGLTGRHVHVGPQLAGDHRPVRAQRAVTRDIEQIPMSDGRHIRGHRLRRGRQLQLQLGQAGFSSHGDDPSLRCAVPVRLIAPTRHGPNTNGWPRSNQPGNLPVRSIAERLPLV